MWNTNYPLGYYPEYKDNSQFKQKQRKKNENSVLLWVCVY